MGIDKGKIWIRDVDYGLWIKIMIWVRDKVWYGLKVGGKVKG